MTIRSELIDELLAGLRNLKCGNLHHAVETVSGFQVI